MADRAQGRRPDNRPGGRGLNCHQSENFRTSVDCINSKRGGGPKTPLYEGKGAENPGVVAPLAVAGCRGNLQTRSGPIRHDMAEDRTYVLWYDLSGRLLSSWSFYCSPIDGASCRASLNFPLFAQLCAFGCRRIFPL